MAEKTDQLTIQHVHYMPETLEPHTLYVSNEYEIAIHLCACGCGIKTVTPIGGPLSWKYTETDGKATLHPSIGNQQFPCQSHYWIRDGKIVWT